MGLAGLEANVVVDATFFLGYCPDYTVEPPVNRRVWADLRAGLDRNAYPAFPRNTEHAHAELARLRALIMMEN